MRDLLKTGKKLIHACAAANAELDVHGNSLAGPTALIAPFLHRQLHFTFEHVGRLGRKDFDVIHPTIGINIKLNPNVAVHT